MQNGPMRLSDMTQSFWQGVVYGPPGCGKTSFATISKLSTFILDVDIGVNTTMARRRKLGMALDNVFVWKIQTVGDYDAAIDWLVAKGNIRYFQLVVIDSATELQRIIIKETADKTKHMTPEQRDWGIIRTVMENTTVMLRYLPCNLIYTCHEIQKFDPTVGNLCWRPSFDGRFAFEYAKHFSFICRLIARAGPTGQVDANNNQIMGVQRVLDFGPDPLIHYKDRSSAMNRYEWPVLDDILARMVASTHGEPVKP